MLEVLLLVTFKNETVNWSADAYSIKEDTSFTCKKIKAQSAKIEPERRHNRSRTAQVSMKQTGLDRLALYFEWISNESSRKNPFKRFSNLSCYGDLSF